MNITPTGNVTEQFELGVISIATGRYLDYWFDFAKSMELNYDKDEALVLYLMTDQPEFAREWVVNNSSLPVRVFQIPSLTWPDATLFRYKLIHNRSALFNSKILVYADADSKVVARLRFEDFVGPDETKMSLVRHPGYWRPQSKFKFYLGNPVLFFKDTLMKIFKGGIGAWESNSKSLAFVNRKLREKYYCGGLWFGPKDKFIDMCETLSTNIELDSQHKIMARWHDESHLNLWAIQNDFNECDPRYCYALEFKHLRRLSPLLVAIKK